MITTNAIHQMIDLEEFSHYGQGIYSTGAWDKVGIEILLRSKHGNPEQIFMEAKSVKRLFELEIKSILKLLYTYIQVTTSREKLFINLFPSTIMHPDFPLFMGKLVKKLPPDYKNKMIFELIESEKVENIALLKKRIKLLKDYGFQIAIDDIGKGWSSLSMIIEIQPEYIKLDRYFSNNLSKSSLKQEMIKSLLTYTQATNSKIILEGIEINADLATAKYLGIPLCQGFLLDEPKPILHEWILQ
ncbi:EAL domain-containing protein [Neobacillus mesonae]|uniref:EAL domain-containing protein n=1 Tax=Neobacillus mesonae TaxID=1193713 RepID=UPI00203DD6F2|nr:EAL domain-containing protein [Neobacillus mesonae]MCM3567014.1 EAL domain-containing protein [Neobacillus mesonae]